MTEAESGLQEWQLVTILTSGKSLHGRITLVRPYTGYAAPFHPLGESEPEGHCCALAASHWVWVWGFHACQLKR